MKLLGVKPAEVFLQHLNTKSTDISRLSLNVSFFYLCDEYFVTSKHFEIQPVNLFPGNKLPPMKNLSCQCIFQRNIIPLIAYTIMQHIPHLHILLAFPAKTYRPLYIGVPSWIIHWQYIQKENSMHYKIDVRAPRKTTTRRKGFTYPITDT